MVSLLKKKKKKKIIHPTRNFFLQKVFRIFPGPLKKSFSHLSWIPGPLKKNFSHLRKKKKMIHPTLNFFLQKVFGIFPGPLKKNFSHLSWKLWKLKTLLSLLSPCYKKKKNGPPYPKIFFTKNLRNLPRTSQKKFQSSKLKTVEVRDFVIIVIAVLSLLLFVII